MGILSKDALLGASDLAEQEVELPSIGGSVVVRSLPAAYSNQAQSEALEMVTTAKGEQIARVNTAKLEILQVLHGMIEPRLASYAEAEIFAQRCGPAFKKVIAVIDEISGVDKEAIERTTAVFPARGEAEEGLDVEPAAANGDR